MAYTTAQAILEGIAKLIKAQDPAAKAAGANHKFKPRSVEATTWDDAPDSDKDRRFTVDYLTRDRVTHFGTVDELDCEGTFRITIMHAVTDDEREGIIRRDTDLTQIQNALEKKANWTTYLSAVFLIRFNNQAGPRRLGKDWWQTMMTFRINYTLQAP